LLLIATLEYRLAKNNDKTATHAEDSNEEATLATSGMTF